VLKTLLFFGGDEGRADRRGRTPTQHVSRAPQLAATQFGVGQRRRRIILFIIVSLLTA
jgi:hypothetical protein